LSTTTTAKTPAPAAPKAPRLSSSTPTSLTVITDVESDIEALSGHQPQVDTAPMFGPVVPVYALSIIALFETFERISNFGLLCSRQNSCLHRGGRGKNCMLLAPCIRRASAFRRSPQSLSWGWGLNTGSKFEASSLPQLYGLFLSPHPL